jgi:outer membrane protein assembly factor BamB
MLRALKPVCLAPILLSAGLPPAFAADQPQWGERDSRNMVSAETGLPDTFDPATGKNLLWAVPNGNESYGTPVVAGGRVFIATNNDPPRDPRLKGDRGVLLCLDAKDGRLVWQLALQKRGPTNFWDWPHCGMCSPPTVEGDRVYMVTNRGEVVALDLAGLANGNDGPYKEEGALFALRGDPPVELAPTDADILWLCDLTQSAGVRQHDSAHSAILVHGPYLYVNTSNGLNDQHSGVENPGAPSLVVLDKATGRIVAREREGIGTNTFHSTWSSPSFGEAGGRPLVVFGGGNGVVYAFEPFRVGGPSGAESAESSSPASLKLVWRFDCDPGSPKENVHKYVRNRRESPSNITGMPVFTGGRVYVEAGGDYWWGKNQAWLKCIDAAAGTGDITATGEVWAYPLKPHCMSTPAVHDGLATIADCGGTVHCVDAKTGVAVWTHEAGGEIWASTLVADGKVYVGTRRGTFWILAAGREKKVLAEIDLKSPVCGSAVAANGTLYVPTMSRLYAVKRKD